MSASAATCRSDRFESWRWLRRNAPKAPISSAPSGGRSSRLAIIRWYGVPPGRRPSREAAPGWPSSVLGFGCGRDRRHQVVSEAALAIDELLGEAPCQLNGLVRGGHADLAGEGADDGQLLRHHLREGAGHGLDCGGRLRL